MPRILLTKPEGAVDVTGLAVSIRWSGDYRQCARSLTLELLSPQKDPSVPGMDCPLGTPVSLLEGEKLLFSGYVFTRSGSTAANTVTIGCCDPGLYLKRNETTKQYASITPEAAVAALCDEFGIQVGHLATTGVAVSRIFVGASLYQVAATLYTLAAEITGKAYTIRFRGLSLCVEEKETEGGVLLLKGRSNLMDASISESAENLVNQVAVYDQDRKLLYEQSDGESIAQYGRMRQVVRQSAGMDASGKVRELLEKSQPEQKITVNCLGDTRCTAGNAVVVEAAGLYGLFWIDSDLHQWKNGVYTNRLTLNLKKVMDRQQAGQAVS